MYDAEMSARYALKGASSRPASDYLPVDVNYDGKMNMYDVGITAASFGAYYGPPIQARWVFRCDSYNDRKINMQDIGMVARHFGETSAVWVPPP